MQIKTRQSNSNKAKSSQTKYGVHKQKGYSQVVIVFWLQDKKEQKYDGWDWEVSILIG